MPHHASFAREVAGGQRDVVFLVHVAAERWRLALQRVSEATPIIATWLNAQRLSRAPARQAARRTVPPAAAAGRTTARLIPPTTPPSALPRWLGVWLRQIVRPGRVVWRRGESEDPRRDLRLVLVLRVAHGRTLAREAAEQALAYPDRRDLFLCHAWDDRQGCAAELDGLLRSHDATVWFSERDVGLGKPLLREIDRGLASSRVGIVLVTPAMLNTLKGQGIADKELSALLATDRVIPVAHGTTFEALREVSPMLASRSGLDTAESSLADVAAQIAAAAATLADAGV